MPMRGIFHRVVKDAIDRARLTWIILICSTTKIRNRCPFEKKHKDVFLKGFFSLLGVRYHLSNGHFILARTVLCLHVKNQDG